MNTVLIITSLNVILILSLVGTGMLRRYALRVNLLDVANERSSHSEPTPRGGGAALVVLTIIGVALSPALFGLDHHVAIGLCGGGALVALIGWLDDHGHIPAGIRLLCHVLSAAWLLWWVGGLPFAELLLGSANIAAVDFALCVLFVCWMINLFNFMDGLDGLAAGQAFVVVVAGLLIMSFSGAGDIAALMPPLVLAAAVLGFLPWNWPPARIFMGDASSGFLGFMLAAFAVVFGQNAPTLGFAWAILPGVFIADATTTLVVRLLRRKRVYEAHRSHAYQILAGKVGEHLPVTVAMNLITMTWLFPIAYMMSRGLSGVLVGMMVAAMPLLATALLMRAGRE